MFTELIGSQPKKQRALGRVALSLALHLTLIYGAVEASKGPEEAALKTRIDTLILPPLAEENPVQPSPRPTDAIVPSKPLLEGFQTVMELESIPTQIPPVDITKRFDPADFTGRSVPEGVAAGSVAGTGQVDLTNGVWLEAELDVPPRVMSAASPRYPPALQKAGVAGKVVYQFVIDSLGRAEPGSFQLKASTNDRFNQPAREAILETVFAPGRTGGKAVRVLVVQGVSFCADR